MKQFLGINNHVYAETMTVGELRDELSKYPPDMPVLATWEGVTREIRTENFEVSEYGTPKDNTPCLWIDVEFNR
jgi:hypothetical protein